MDLSQWRCNVEPDVAKVTWKAVYGEVLENVEA